MLPTETPVTASEPENKSPWWGFSRIPKPGNFNFWGIGIVVDACWQQDAPSWHVYLYVFGPANLNSRNSTWPSSTIHPMTDYNIPPKARRRNQNPPRHTSPFQKCRILLMLTLLVPMPISFQNWAQAVPSHGQQLPNLSLSCQTASLVKQLLLLILQYHTLPIYPSRALCKFKVLCSSPIWTKLNLGGGQICFFRGPLGPFLFSF